LLLLSIIRHAHWRKVIASNYYRFIIDTTVFKTV
jgi:hypothetical protein